MAAHPKSSEAWECRVGAVLETWPPEKRRTLAAAMAERWLPRYEAFSVREGWGDPAALRATLEAVWAHLAGHPLQAPELARRKRQLQELTPHMDDFDAPDAMAACVMVGAALDACASIDPRGDAIQAVLSGFEACAPDWELDEDELPKRWKSAPVQREQRRQQALLDRIDALARVDEVSLGNLRAALAGPELKGEAPERPAPPPGTSNRELFGIYRRMVEGDLRDDPRPDYAADPTMLAMTMLAIWGGRYRRRRDTITGRFSRPADLVGLAALERHLEAEDAVEAELPRWDPELATMIGICMANSANGIDTRDLATPHRFGPSLRALWARAGREGKDDTGRWQAVVAWARHRPLAWAEEDARKKGGRGRVAPALSAALERPIAWTAGTSPARPWQAGVDGACWEVALGDFPDARLYALWIDGREIGPFHDWPGGWTR